MTRVETKIVRKPIKMTALSIAVAQVALAWGGVAHAQTEPAGDPQTTTVVVTGQRAAMQSATKLKQYADEVIDAVVAEEAGKLPDRSITEVLQRVAGVTIDRNNRGDPEHFNVEGSGISVRGLTWGSSTLNGRESFSAGWPGRELSWGDVPPELMSAVVVHKNPPAELIEGGVSGQVDLRTALPFDYKDSKVALSVNGNYNALGSKKSPGISGLVSKRWKTRTGEWGTLLDLSANETNSHNDSLQMDAYYPRTDIVNGKTVWVPKSAEFRTNTGKNDRAGIYGALQWKSNDKSMESALTYFHSGYKGSSKEYATFSGVGGNPESPYNIKVLNPVFDERGVLQKGTLTMPIGGLGANQFAAGGLAFNSGTSGGESRSQTREIAWNFKWNINDRWSLQNDVQWVHATDSSNGYSMIMSTFAPRVNVDMSGGLPNYTYDDATRAFLADRKNYYLYNIMPSLGKADGDLYAWKGDVRYHFDNPILRDLRFGARVTQRTANHFNNYGWKSMAEPWAVLPTDVAGQLPSAQAQQGQWQPRVNMGYFSDPRYGNLVPTTVRTFPNFFNGKVPAVPNMVAPTDAYAANYPASYAQAMTILKLLCEDGHTAKGTTGDCSNADGGWKPLDFNDPSHVSNQKERTEAVYGQLRFGFDELRFPVEGNLGVRVVRTNSNSHGFMIFNPTYGATTPPSVPQFGTVNAPIQVKNTYTDVLPSLNLKADLTDKLQTRIAFAKSMYRPSFGDLSEYVNLSQTITTATNAQGVSQVQSVAYTGSDSGNGKLKPIRANSFDWTLEWYPGNGSSLTLALFRKNVSDIILQTGYLTPVKDLAGNAQNFLVTGPDNVAKGSVTGAELAGQTYFNNVPGLDRILPDWAKGFGISANYTYIDSKQTLYHPFDQKYCPANGSFNNSSVSIFGCDTNGLPFTKMPLQYLSKNAFNVMFLYDRGPVSARLAYSWRSRFLQGVGTNGTGGPDGTSADPAREDANGNEPKDVAWGLPTWQEATGMLDFGVDYKFTDHMTGSFSASNLTDVVVRQTQQQTVGNMGRAWFEPGRSYRVTMRYSF
jgi:TonB-dependent receptor